MGESPYYRSPVPQRDVRSRVEFSRVPPCHTDAAGFGDVLRTSTRVRTLPRYRRRWSHAQACPQARRSCRATREPAAAKLCLVDARIRERGPRLARADRHAYRRAARISAGGLGVPGGARVGLRRSGERGKQITQVRLVRGTAQHGTDLEDLFHRPQRRAVVIVD